MVLICKNIRKNKFSGISSSIFGMTRLVELDLSDNNIEIIPDEISNLENLTKLFLNHNQISQMSKSLG